MDENQLKKARIRNKRTILQWLLGFYWLSSFTYTNLIIMFGFGGVKQVFSIPSTAFGAFYGFLCCTVFLCGACECGFWEKRKDGEFDDQTDLFCFATFQFFGVGSIGLLILPIHVMNLESRIGIAEDFCLALLVLHVAMFVLTFAGGCVAISMHFDIKELQQNTGSDIEAPRLNRNPPNQNSNPTM